MAATATARKPLPPARSIPDLNRRDCERAFLLLPLSSLFPCPPSFLSVRGLSSQPLFLSSSLSLSLRRSRCPSFFSTSGLDRRGSKKPHVRRPPWQRLRRGALARGRSEVAYNCSPFYFRPSIQLDFRLFTLVVGLLLGRLSKEQRRRRVPRPQLSKSRGWSDGDAITLK